MIDRRDFLKQGSKLLIGGGIAGSILGCKDLHDFYSYDVTLQNGVTWTNLQLAVDIGSEGTLDTVNASDPTVIKDASTYKMWYTGNGNKIIYCESTNGINWSSFQLSVSNGSQGIYDGLFARQPTVIKYGSTYKMWYVGNGSRIIYCESSDGINWSNFQLSVNFGSQGTYDTVNASEPTVIKDSSTYKMWYTGNDGTNWRVIYCESSDGINWSNFQLSVDITSQGIYDTSRASSPTVMKDGSTYKMWYNGSNGTNARIIYCESTNGISWYNFQLSVNIGSQGTYDVSHANSPSVINENGVGKMWYAGNDGTNQRIIYCETY